MDNQKLRDKLRGQGDVNTRNAAALEVKVQSLTEELKVTQDELDTIKEEYDSYKVSAGVLCIMYNVRG